MSNQFILLTHTDLDGYGSNLLLQAYGINAKVVNLENTKVDSYVLEMIRRLKSGEMETPTSLFITDLGLQPEVAKKLNDWYQDLDRSKRPLLKLFDHHKTALHLNQYDWAKVVVGETLNKPSGTSLLNTFFKNETDLQLPAEQQNNLDCLVELIRSYDTWEWKATNNLDAKKLNDLFYLLRHDRFIQHRTNWIRTNIDKGSYFFEDEKFLLSIETEKIKNYLKGKAKNMVILDRFFKKGKQDYFKVGVVQAEDYISELGDYLCINNAHLDFVVMFDVTRNKASFRARNANIDLTPIVKSFGGGGHSQAAGCSINALGVDFLKSIFEEVAA